VRMQCVVVRASDRVYQWLGAWLYRRGWFGSWIGQRMMDVASAPMHLLCDGGCDGGC